MRQLSKILVFIFLSGLASTSGAQTAIHQRAMENIRSNSSNYQAQIEREQDTDLLYVYSAISITFLATVFAFFAFCFYKELQSKGLSNRFQADLNYHYSKQKTKLYVANVAAEFSRTNRPRKYKPEEDFDARPIDPTRNRFES